MVFLKLAFRVLFLILIYLNPAHALNVLSAKTTGQGGAGRARIDPVDSLYTNPAALAHFRNRYFSSVFRTNESAITLYDSALQSSISGALGFYEIKENQDNLELIQRFKIHVISFGLAAVSPNFNSGRPLDQWAMGFSFHQNQKMFSYKTTTLNSLDFGLLFTPYSFLGIGASI